MIPRPALATATAAALSCMAVNAAAQPGGVEDRREGDRDWDHAIGMVEVGVGLLSLPGAKVCVAREQAGCTQGDGSLMLEAWQLVRPTRRFAIGAGITLALTPTTEAPQQSGTEFAREHQRGYFTGEATARYYLWLASRSEVWLGAIGGLVVISDNFSSTDPAPNQAFVGRGGVTLRTEGYSLGLGAGGAYEVAPRWLVGGSVRYSSWFLPRAPAHDAFGYQASLTGRNSVLVLGASIAYQLPL